jgi:hypothetical protein
MTCIVALRDRYTWVGADSALTFEDHRLISPDPKIVRRGDCIVGTAGDAPFCQVIESIDWPERTTEHWIRKVLPRLLARSLDGPTGEIVIAAPHGLYGLDDGYAVYTSLDPWIVIGNGAPWAEGALSATHKRAARSRVILALGASARYCTGVAPPFRVMRLSHT